MSPTNPNNGLEPSCEPLLRLAFQQVDESMLREIAEADYGMDADAHLAALHAIKDGDVPAPMSWEPKEVLELVRWSEPQSPAWNPGSVGTRGHWMRLFSCAVLLRSAAEPESDGYFLGEDSTIIQLVDSALTLGQEASLAALQFLRWRTRYRDLNEWDNSYFAIAILFLSVSLDQCDEQMATSLIAVANSDDRTVTELLAECQKAQTWKDVARRTLIEASRHNKEIEAFGNALIGNTA